MRHVTTDKLGGYRLVAATKKNPLFESRAGWFLTFDTFFRSSTYIGMATSWEREARLRLAGSSSQAVSALSSFPTAFISRFLL